MKTLKKIFRLFFLLIALSNPLTSNADAISDMLSGVTNSATNAVSANPGNASAQESAIIDIVNAAIAANPTQAAAIAAAAAKAAPQLRSGHYDCCRNLCS